MLRIKIYDVNNPTDADTATWVINSVDYAGVNDLNQNIDLSIFPNPCNSYFSISTELNVDYVELVGIDGRIVHTQNYTPNDLVEMSHVPAALYIVKMYTDGELVGLKKLIKNV